MTVHPPNQNPYQYPAMGQPGSPPPPGFVPYSPTWCSVSIPTMWRRLGARLLDMLVLLVVMLVVIGAIMGTLLAIYADRMDEPNPPVGFIIGALLCYLVAFLTGIAYEVVFIAKRGATPGKAMLGMRVVRLDNQQNPGMGAALMRWFLPFIAGVVFPLSILVYISPWFDGTKWLRGWHDKAAGVLVTRIR